MKQNSGLTLMELLITTLILSIGTLAAIGSYQYISTSVQLSKGRTLASNLAQEQIEKLKNLSYYTLLVTTATVTDNRFTPPLTYDRGNYPKQTIVEGGITFERSTRIDFAYETGSSISTTAYTSEDTALKQISVFVMWKEREIWKNQHIQSLFANPAASPLSAAAAGRVTKAGTATAIPGAYVQIIDNSNWYGTADAAGNYRFSVSEGSYTIQCSSNGYYTGTTNGYKSFTSAVTTTVDFALSAIGSGTVSGYLYQNDRPVISQVTASSIAFTGWNQEWIEIYNPSTFTWTIATGPTSPVIDVYYDRKGQAPVLVGMTYHQLTVPSHSYYIFANTPTIVVNGQATAVDAEFDSSTLNYPNVMATYQDIGVNNSGGVRLTLRSTGETIDQMGWRSNLGGFVPGFYEGAPLNEDQGIDDGEQYVRMSSPSVTNSNFGNAYDSDNNLTNFTQNMMATFISPRGTTSGVRHPISGSPLTGAVVRMNDLLNQTATCDNVLIGGIYNACQFTLEAATGTWTMEISSGSRFTQIQNVSIATPLTSTGVPNGMTIPTWASVSTYTVTLVNDTTNFAFISGRILNGSGAPVAGIRVTDGNGRSTSSSASGLYNLISTTGAITLTANPNDGTKNRSYSTQALDEEVFQAATLYGGRNFTLELSGIIRGYFQTSSNTPLPGRIAQAVKSIGTERGESAADNTGYFYIQNLSTGTYTVSPLIDTMETATPALYTFTMASTGTFATVSTFTITSGIAQITGQVLVGATAIKTGALVIASSSTIASANPPRQLGSTGEACAPCYYSASSDATGNYTLYVRSSTQPYKVYGWYSTISGDNASVNKTVEYSVLVSTPGQIIGQNLTW